MSLKGKETKPKKRNYGRTSVRGGSEQRRKRGKKKKDLDFSFRKRKSAKKKKDGLQLRGNPGLHQRTLAQRGWGSKLTASTEEV